MIDNEQQARDWLREFNDPVYVSEKRRNQVEACALLLYAQMGMLHLLPADMPQCATAIKDPVHIARLYQFAMIVIASGYQHELLGSTERESKQTGTPGDSGECTPGPSTT